MSTANRFYEMLDDMSVPGRWVVKSPVEGSGERSIPRQFLKEGPLHIEREPLLKVSLPGVALDFSQTGFGIIVISQRLRNLYDRLGVRADCQFIPCRIEGQAGQYFILHTLRVIRCIDESRCEEVEFAPDGSGRYKHVWGLKIDPTKTGDSNIFRPWGWKVALIVSERVKLAMEEEGMTGAKFIEV